MKRIIAFALLAALLTGAYGCSSMTRAQKGMAIGGGAGAAVGAVVGKQLGNTAVGAIVGAAVGGAAGGYIGHYMDEQAAEMDKDIEGAKIERVGEGIKITFESGLLFDVNSDKLQPAGSQNIEKLAAVLNKYSDTNVLIEGHTDSSGSEEHNMELSRRRAQSVATLLATSQVDATRFTVMGYGEGQPIADNTTDVGKDRKSVV